MVAQGWGQWVAGLGDDILGREGCFGGDENVLKLVVERCDNSVDLYLKLWNCTLQWYETAS